MLMKNKEECNRPICCSSDKIQGVSLAIVVHIMYIRLTVKNTVIVCGTYIRIYVAYLVI